jgi:hypothetical protein
MFNRLDFQRQFVSDFAVKVARQFGNRFYLESLGLQLENIFVDSPEQLAYTE